MSKAILKNYSFSVANKTITLTDIATVRLDKLALITDTTTNKILYNFADSTVATATVATNVITLSVLQGGEANGDKLRIDYDVESSDTSAFADTIQPVDIKAGAGTQYTTGDPTVALPVGTMPVYDNSGTIAKVGINSGLPIQYDGLGSDFPVNIQNAVLDVQQLGAASNLNVAAALVAGTDAIGRVGHDITSVGDGRTVVTTAGTRVPLAASTACKKVDITAETDNTGIIVVGGTTVVAALATRQGIPLNAGDTYSIEIDNLNDINLDSTVSTDGVTYTWFN